MQRVRLMDLAEEARQGAISQEDFDRRLSDYAREWHFNGLRQWYPVLPPSPEKEPPEQFRRRMETWLRDMQNNPRSIPQPPLPELPH